MPQTITPLTPEQEAWIQGQLDEARRFVDAFSPEDAEQPLSVGTLDRALAAWLLREVSEPTQVAAAIHALGVAFGQSLVQGLGMRWVAVVDERGSELAVHGLPGRGDVMIFPSHLVATRYQKGEPHFLVKSYHMISSHIRAMGRAGKE